MNTEQTAVAQINQKATETIVSLSARLSEIEQAIMAAQFELESFPKQREQRTSRLNSEQSQIITLQGGLSKAEAYARVAMGTLGEKGAIKAVSSAKKKLSDAQRIFDSIASMIRKEQDEADTREQELHAQIATLQGEYQAIQAELQTTRIAKEQAHSELGTLKSTAIQDRLNARQAQIDTLTRQLVKLKIEHHDDVEQAIQEMAEWSDHRAQLRKQYPCTDATVEILEHEIAYVTALLRNAQSIPYNDNLFNLLAIPANELHYGEHLQRDPKGLKSRLAELQTLLSQHQATLQR